MSSVLVVGENGTLDDVVSRAMRMGRTRVVGAVSTLEEAIRASEADPPDVVFLPLKDGWTPHLDLAPIAKDRPRWLIVAPRASAALAQLCADHPIACLAGYRTAEEVATAVELCAQGAMFISANLVRLLPARRSSGSWSETDVRLLMLLSRGISHERIARELNYSVGTVRNMCSRLYRRLGSSNRLSALVEARRIALL